LIAKGGSHTLDIYFVKTADANQFNVLTYIDGSRSTSANATTPRILGLPFTTSGAYDAAGGGGDKGTFSIDTAVAGAV
jgi:hypothetical protein